MKSLELYFFRHGIAAPDGDRPLTEDGLRKTRTAAEGLKRMEITFDKILTSPWLRAVQTASLLSEVLAMPPAEEMPELAGDRSVDDLLEALSQHPAARRILLVGHEPLLSGTIVHLLGEGATCGVDMRKSGACAIEVDGIPPRKPATLLWLLTPKQLRMIAKH